MTQAVQLAQYGSSNATLGFKNRIINGNMQFWQRGTSFTGIGAIVYYADRWCGIQYAGSTSTITQATNIGLTGFQYALRAQRPASSSNLNSINVGQSIESNNCLDLAGKTVTLSFYARAGANFSATSNILLSQITTGTGTDQNIYGTYTGASTTNQNNTISTTWTRFTQTILVPSNTTEIGVSFNYTPTGTAGASDFYEITGVQLEVGSEATSFDVRSVGTELQLCQRYYYKATSGTLFNQIAFCNVRTTTSHYAFLQLPVTLRTNPTSVDYSGLGVIAAWGTGVTSLNSLTLADAAYGAGTTQVLLNAVTAGAVGTVGNISFLLSNNSANGYVALNAEL